MSSTVLVGDQVLLLDQARVVNGHLWVPVDQLRRLNGFELRGEGFCRGDACVPLTAKGVRLRSDFEQTLVDATWFAHQIGQPIAANPALGIWSFGQTHGACPSMLSAGLAPDFSLPDRHGNLVRLSGFRKRKVLLLAWASW